ncbi:VCBS repeat-containing protein [bacterium]|nr:VCBS repeat-containing protein [bacterium]
MRFYVTLYCLFSIWAAINISFAQEFIVIDEWGHYIVEEVVDMDGDHDLDILVTQGEGFSVGCFQRVDADTWIRRSIDDGTTLEGVTGALAFDMENDGDVDVLAWRDGIEGFNPARLVWYERISMYEFEPHIIEEIGGEVDFEPQVTDMDGDGLADIFLLISFDGVVFNQRLDLYKYSGDGIFSIYPWVSYVQDNIVSFDLADLDGDSDIDLVAGFYNFQGGNDPYGVWAYITTGPQSRTPELLFNSAFGQGFRDITVADPNSDGIPDILTSFVNPIGIYKFYIQSGGSWEPITLPDQPFGGWTRTPEVVDYNCDGQQDVILWGFIGDEDVVVYLNNGELDFTYTTPLPISLSRPLEVADMDLDGDGDLLTSGVAGLGWYENDTDPGPVRVRLVPVVSSGSAGETLTIGLSVFHASQTLRSGQIWAVAHGPFGGSRIVGHEHVFFLPGQGIEVDGKTITIPNTINPGVYDYVVHAGNYPNSLAADTLTFTVQGR